MSTIDLSDLARDRFGRIASPCIDICTLDDEDLCIGCQRNIDEICAWAAASDAERQQIMTSVKTRRESKDD